MLETKYVGIVESGRCWAKAADVWVKVADVKAADVWGKAADLPSAAFLA